MIGSKLRSLRWALPALVLLTLLVHNLYEVQKDVSISSSVAEVSSNRGHNTTKTILVYTPYFHMKDWDFGFGQEPFVRHKCPVTNCFVTNERRYLPHYGDYDAIVFHIRDLNDFPEQHTRRSEQVLRNSRPELHE